MKENIIATLIIVFLLGWGAWLLISSLNENSNAWKEERAVHEATCTKRTITRIEMVPVDGGIFGGSLKRVAYFSDGNVRETYRDVGYSKCKD